jgi:hypothetical protein
MRRNGHPSRPRAITCCFFASLKTLLISTKATVPCVAFNVPEPSFSLAGFQVTAEGLWNPEQQRWEGHYARLPIYENAGVLLVPKVAVRRCLVPDSREFYDQYVLRFLEAEHLHARDSLVYSLKNGNPKVYVSDLRAKYPVSKEFLFDFSEENPTVLKSYKETLPEKAAEAIADESIEGRQWATRRIDHGVRAPELRSIPPGPAAASKMGRGARRTFPFPMWI